MPTSIFCAVRCETYIESFRRRRNHANTALIRCHRISTALVERSACCRFVKAAMRVVRHHRIGMLAAYTESPDLRLFHHKFIAVAFTYIKGIQRIGSLAGFPCLPLFCGMRSCSLDERNKYSLIIIGSKRSRFIDLCELSLAAVSATTADLQCNGLCHKRYIVAAGSGSAAKCLAGVILTDTDSSVCRMILHGECRRNDTGSQCGRYLFLVADASCLCAVFRGKSCRLQDTVPSGRHPAVHTERCRCVIGDRGVIAVNADSMKNRRVIAVILCDQCESLFLCDTDTRSALTVHTEGSTSSVSPPACLSSAFFSTSGSSLPRTEALRSIPRHAFGLK
mgnify:CR=1 FL=1